MKYLLSVLILAACLNFNLTNLTGQALADENLTGQAHADEHGQMYMGPETAVEKALEGQQGSAPDSEVRTGTWTVEDGVLLVKWDNGANTKRRYRINGNALEMLNKKGKVVTAYQR